jgi:two-component system nitrate/nitrite response regulator NarL
MITSRTHNGSPIRVVVVDGQHLFRAAVVRAFRQDARFHVVGETADGRAGLDMIVRLDPDVAVVDVVLPSLDGERLLRAITRVRPATRVILLATTVTDEAAHRVIAAGAAAYLLKTVTDAELLASAATVAAGGTVMAPSALAGLARAVRRRSAHEGPVLSGREGEILRRVAAGESVPAIAGAMHVSPATVKTHLSHVYDKLETRERAAAVARAMRLGLLD